MLKKQDILMASIQDTQNTIRSIDTKLNIFLGICLVPGVKFIEIFYGLKYLSNISIWGVIGSVCFYAVWLALLLTITRGVAAIDNPSLHITNSDECSGIFYSAGLFQHISILDAILNRKVITAKVDINKFVTKIPSQDDSQIKELGFEFMKLVYIREIKLYRLKVGTRFLYLWIAIGAINFLCFEIHKAISR